MIIWYIHGAGASTRSFTWLQSQLGEFSALFFDYKIEEPAKLVIDRLSQAIRKDGRPALLMGHSLGGVFAVVCGALPNVERVVTLCTPFGGVRHADMLAFFSSHPLFHDLRSHGSLLTGVRRRSMVKPHLAIVGTCGLPFMHESNDGAVTVASQMALPDIDYTMLPLNHFEVLLSDDVVVLVRDFIRGTNNNVAYHAAGQG